MDTPIQRTDLGLRRLETEATQLRQPRVRPHGAEDVSFKDMLAEAVAEVRNLQTEADNTIKKLVAGEITDVTEAMVAVEKADLAFQTMMTVRNKVVTAYEEIMRMQV
ncbi:MAG TPA: flagellar hook-basal body complex protein FliE [Candidatus Hydrogenedentes bacterium]|nr:flagellar hook-basal body complex protein FliE [Candidatus Hydrogenedentota bacterium]